MDLVALSQSFACSLVVSVRPSQDLSFSLNCPLLIFCCQVRRCCLCKRNRRRVICHLQLCRERCKTYVLRVGVFKDAVRKVASTYAGAIRVSDSRSSVTVYAKAQTLWNLGTCSGATQQADAGRHLVHPHSRPTLLHCVGH